MVTKSLPTFKHTSIGAKTHKPRTATAHLSYIMRSEAMTEFQAENMPGGERGTRVFFDRLWEKGGMKESARIADKLMIALPVELDREQRYELVRSFMQELGHGGGSTRGFSSFGRHGTTITHKYYGVSHPLRHRELFT